MTTYTITNDRYSNQADKVTFGQLVEMCQENDFDTNLTERGGKIYDSKGEVVAEKEILSADQITEIVEEWVSNNPERLSYAYDNAALFLDWKREAAKRVASNEENAVEVLEVYAAEAEAAHA
jgi:hypothetical protein